LWNRAAGYSVLVGKLDGAPAFVNDVDFVGLRK